MSRKQDYLNKRKVLLDEADKMLAENKLDDFQKKTKEIRQLDSNFENSCKAEANLNALKEKHSVANFENNTNKNLKQFETFELQDKTDENTTYKNAFGKFLLGTALDSNEQDIFDKINHEFKNAAGLTTSSNNGAVIPETMMQEIVKKMAETHPVLTDIKGFNIKGVVSFPTEGECIEAEQDFYEETDETGDDEVKTAEVSLSGYDLSRGVNISWKLKKMSVDAFITYVIDRISEKLGNALAYGVINGKGIAKADDSWKSQPLGVITALNKETDTPRILTYTDTTTSEEMETKIRAMLAKVKGGYNPCFYANNTTIWNVLAGIKDKTGASYFVSDPTSGGVGRIFGRVVKEEDALADNVILLGGFSRYVVNFNERISILSQDNNKKRQTYYSGYGLVDGKPLINEAFCCLKKA